MFGWILLLLMNSVQYRSRSSSLDAAHWVSDRQNALWTWRLYQCALLGLLTFSSSVILRLRYSYSSGRRSGEVCAGQSMCNTTVNQKPQDGSKHKAQWTPPRCHLWLNLLNDQTMQFKQGWLSGTLPTSTLSSLAFSLSPFQSFLSLVNLLSSSQSVWKLVSRQPLANKSNYTLREMPTTVPVSGFHTASAIPPSAIGGHVCTSVQIAVVPFQLTKQRPPTTYMPMLIAAKYCEMTLFPLSIVLYLFF